jgi:hypothetical protein
VSSSQLRVPRRSSQAPCDRQIEFSRVVHTASVEIRRSEPFAAPVGSVVSGAPFVKRCVPVASVKRQLRTVASQFVASPSVASASPRAVLSSTLQKCRRAATTMKSKRTLERLAKPSSSVASRASKQRAVALH